MRVFPTITYQCLTRHLEFNYTYSKMYTTGEPFLTTIKVLAWGIRSKFGESVREGGKGVEGTACSEEDTCDMALEMSRTRVDSLFSASSFS